MNKPRLLFIRRSAGKSSKRPAIFSSKSTQSFGRSTRFRPSPKPISSPATTRLSIRTTYSLPVTVNAMYPVTSLPSSKGPSSAELGFNHADALGFLELCPIKGHLYWEE